MALMIVCVFCIVLKFLMSVDIVQVPLIAAHGGPHPQEGDGANGAMAGAIMTSPSIMPRDRAEALWPLIGKYVVLAASTSGHSSWCLN